MNRIRILIADDHLVVRMGLKSLIDSEPDMTVVAEASNGEEAIELFRQHSPDIVLMDLRMPRLGGVEATVAIRQEFPDARIVILTTYDEDENIYRALHAGARAYLLKDVPRNDFLSHLRAVHSGHYPIPPMMAERLARRMPQPELSSRELEVLKLIVKGLRACFKIEKGPAARDFGCGQGGETGASPQRAVTVEPTLAAGKRPAARRVFAEKAAGLRCSSVTDRWRVCSLVAPRPAAFSAKTGPF